MLDCSEQLIAFDEQILKPEKILTAYDLCTADLERPPWCVEGLFPEGYILCGGKEKEGKSLMAMGIAADVAAGRPVFGEFATQPGNVLYYGMEDSKYRLADRWRQLEQVTTDSDLEHLKRIYPILDLPKLDNGGLAVIASHILALQPKLVILDTVGKLWPSKASGDTEYGAEYQWGGDLQKLALDNHIPIVGITHLTKYPYPDPYDRIRGTGTKGATDLMMILESSGLNEFSFRFKGRDVEERIIRLKRDPTSLAYRYAGDIGEGQPKMSTRARKPKYDVTPDDIFCGEEHVSNAVAVQRLMHKHGMSAKTASLYVTAMREQYFDPKRKLYVRSLD